MCWQYVASTVNTQTTRPIVWQENIINMCFLFFFGWIDIICWRHSLTICTACLTMHRNNFFRDSRYKFVLRAIFLTRHNAGAISIWLKASRCIPFGFRPHAIYSWLSFNCHLLFAVVNISAIVALFTYSRFESFPSCHIFDIFFDRNKNKLTTTQREHKKKQCVSINCCSLMQTQRNNKNRTEPKVFVCILFHLIGVERCVFFLSCTFVATLWLCWSLAVPWVYFFRVRSWSKSTEGEYAFK